MEFCGYCLNHGLKFLIYEKDHKDNCPLRRCVCKKCRKVAAKDPNRDICVNGGNYASTSNSSQQYAGSNPNDSQPVGGHHLNAILPNTDRLDEVRTIAQELAKYGISENDMQTCALYALLQSNSFSIADTKNQLCQSRTAIAESVVLPAFSPNREPYRKRSQNRSNDSNVRSVSSQSISTKKSTKNLCSLQSKAKKSFHRKPIDGRTKATNVSNCFDQTIVKQSQVLTPKLSNSETTLSTIETEVRPENNIASAVKTVLSETVAPMKTTVTTANKTYVIRPYANPSINFRINAVPIACVAQTITKPIQSVRPLSNTSSAPTKLITVNSSPVTSCEPTTTGLSPVCPPSVHTSSHCITAADFYSPQKVAKKSKKSLKRMGKSVQICDNPTPNLIIFQNVENGVNSTQNHENIINKYFSNSRQKIKTFSKITLTSQTPRIDDPIDKSTEPKLVSKVITTEAALAALSAIPDTSLEANQLTKTKPPSIGSTSISDNQPPVPLCQAYTNCSPTADRRVPEANGNSASVPQITTKLETSYSDQFKLFLDFKNTRFDSHNTNIEEQTSSSNTKEIIEITID